MVGPGRWAGALAFTEPQGKTGNFRETAAYGVMAMRPRRHSGFLGPFQNHPVQ